MPRSAAPALLGVLALAACGRGSVSIQQRPPEVGEYSAADRIRVMLSPPDPGGEAASRAVSARVIAVLQQTHADVALVPTANEEEALAATRQAKAAFLISPTILEWVDGHAPPLTADRIKVRLALLDPGAGDVVSQMTFENSDSLLTMTDTTPDSLLDASFDRSVRLLLNTGTPGRGTVRQPGPAVLENVPVDEQKYPRQ